MGEMIGKEYLTAQQRRFVLRAIGEYKSTNWIVKALFERWEVDRKPITIDQNYRYNAGYREQIKKYRESFNAREREHPLFNRQVILDYLLKGMDIAVEDRDGKALASLAKQASDITGIAAPTELEITHHNGSQSFEEILKAITSKEEPDTIDAQVEPIPDPILPILPPAQNPEPSIDTSFQDQDHR